MTIRSRCAPAFVALALMALPGCATERGLSRARQADDLRDYDAAVAQYAKVVREHPDNREAQLGLQRAKLRASDAHLARGRRLVAVGKFEDAVLELQIASDLNPTSGDAERDLRAARMALRAKLAAPPEGKTALETMLARTDALSATGYELPHVKLPAQVATGSQATSRQLYLAIARLTNLSVVFDPAFADAPAPVTLLNDMTVEQALDAIARSTRTFYQVTGPATITVVPDTPAKRREYTEEAERVFFVQNADLKETIDALRTVSDIRSISPITGVNAILVRDTPQRLEVASRFLSAFDKARPELVVDVEILEVDRTKLMEYGLQIASPASDGTQSPGIDGSAAIDESGLTVQGLASLSRSDILLSGVPALYYRLLKTDTNTRTLANPHLRMSDGVTATAAFGERIPTPNATIGAVATGGVGTIPITQYHVLRYRGEHRDHAARASERRGLARRDHRIEQRAGHGLRRTADVRQPPGGDDAAAEGWRDEHPRRTDSRRRAVREGRDSRSLGRAGPRSPLHAKPQGSDQYRRRDHAHAAHRPRAERIGGGSAAADAVERGRRTARFPADRGAPDYPRTLGGAHRQSRPGRHSPAGAARGRQVTRRAAGPHGPAPVRRRRLRRMQSAGAALCGASR